MPLGILFNNLIILAADGFIRYYPKRKSLRVPLWLLLLVYAVVFCIQVLFLYFEQSRFTGEYWDGQIYQTLAGLLVFLLPFFFVRMGFFQNLFLLSIVVVYNLIVLGIANFVELRFGGVLAQTHPYLISNIVKLPLIGISLPLLSRVLKKLFALWPEDKGLWQLFWLLPLLFAGLCLLSGGFFQDTSAITSLLFILSRLLVCAGCALTCYLMAQTFQKEAQASAVRENARAAQHLLELERDQYEHFRKSIEAEAQMRHNLRHQLAVLKKLQQDGDAEGLKDYIESLICALPPATSHNWCEHYSCNAIASHYLSLIEEQGIILDARFEVPKDIGAISDTDICIVLGNLLENALEACLRMEEGHRYIKLRSLIQGNFLSLMVENSSDGVYRYMENGLFYSRKASDGGEREGLGLASVNAVCQRYNGYLKTEAMENAFRTSALLDMGLRSEVNP
ncbi:MAG: GHKL domain-containing protein [Clostridia bacterium]|nr:GHKL domain-containing protein [Clostridia bacterium]